MTVSKQSQDGTTVPSIHSFIHSAVCLTTGPQPLPMRVPTVCDLVLPLSFQYPVVFLR